MKRLFGLLIFIWFHTALAATTIAIIDTGFDLDHEFLRPKIFKRETDQEFNGQSFHDNSHLKEAVIKDQSLLQEVLLYRNLRAKGHQEGLSLAEFEWFEKRSANKKFMSAVKKFKKHSHGTFVAGIALREGENINLFPIRGLHLPTPTVSVEDNSNPEVSPILSKTPEEKFKEEIRHSQDRVVKKFAKICKYLNLNRISIVNASYGITYKNITTKFRERYKEITKTDISEMRLKLEVDEYFKNLMDRTSAIIKKYPRMLFVFSAGNSGIDNDLFPHYPSKIKLPNTLSIGAMNGDYLASFSNYGQNHVDVGAPGVAILSLVPKVYSTDGKDLYSPSSGTSMAAPYVSNLAAQILNLNPSLTPENIKRIIMETGDEKEHLKSKLISGAIANNQKALRTAQLSKEMLLDQAINLAKSGLMPVQDMVSMGQPPAVSAEDVQTNIMNAIPRDITPGEIEEIQTTSEESSLPLETTTNKPDNSVPLPSVPETAKPKLADPIPSNQNVEQSPLPSEDLPPSSSESQPQAPQTPDLAPEPSLP